MPAKKYSRDRAFGARLKAEIIRQFGSQTNFCRTKGFTDSAVSGYVNGVVPEWPGLVELRNALGVTIDFLLVGQAAEERLDELPRLLQTTIARIKPHPEFYQSLERCARLLTSGDDRFDQPLVERLRIDEQWLEQLRRDYPTE